MDGFSSPGHVAAEAQRLARIERDNAIIAKAEANIAAGLGIEFEEAMRWLEALDGNDVLPFPKPHASLPVPGGS